MPPFVAFRVDVDLLARNLLSELTVWRAFPIIVGSTTVPSKAIPPLRSFPKTDYVTSTSVGSPYRSSFFCLLPSLCYFRLAL